MTTEYRELKVNDYTIRGLFQYEEGFKQVVVMLHGFTGHKNEHANMFKQFVSTLVPMGYATLRYDYYGSGDSDGEFSLQTFKTVLADAEAAVKDGFKILNKKIIVLGFSMGGATAALMTARFPELIDKAVLISPAGTLDEHIELIFKNRNLIDGTFVDLGGYYISKAYADSFEGISLYEGMDKFEGKVLIIQGSADTAVDPVTSFEYTKIYKKVKYLTVEGATHGYATVEYRKMINQYIKDFLEEDEKC